MNNLEKLINKLCPDGVEYKKIGEVFNVITDYTAAGSFADIAKNVTYLKEQDYAQLIRTTDLKSKFSNPESFVYVDEHAFNYLWRVNINEDCIVMPNVGNCGEVYYVEPSKLPNTNNVLGPYAVLLRAENNNLKYLYYCLDNKIFKKKLRKITSSTGQSKFNKTNLKDLTIPLPPLEIQSEIVHILDDFTSLLEELSAELNIRQKQYSYYKDNSIMNAQNTKKYKLSDIAKIYDGTHQTPQYTNSGVSFISVENILDIYQSKKYISKEDYDKYKVKPEIGDVFMTRIGTIGKCAIYDKKMDLAYYVSLALIRPDKEIINSYYLKYLIESTIGAKELRKRTLVNAVPIKINKDDIGKIVLPIPPLDVQEKIVRILDKFENICNNITSGLPAEIEKRQMQYEYYRDLLLNFKEVQHE